MKTAKLKTYADMKIKSVKVNGKNILIVTKAKKKKLNS